MIKIALVNQRYGMEVNGGSEFYTRLIAEKLNNYYSVEILTTRALDYITWENHYSEGLQNINGIPVRRFSVIKERNVEKFNIVNANLLNSPFHTEDQENEWFEEQGPLSFDLIKYIEQNKDNYDIFIFVTYLYYHTVKSLPMVADKSILIPTAHDEPYIYFKYFKKMFKLPRAIIFLTEDEREFVHNKFRNSDIKYDVMGIGVKVPEVINGELFKNKYNITDDYIIYVGRIDQSKGCDWLFKYFAEYKQRYCENKLKLVLVGKNAMDIPRHKDIKSLGFISEEDKFNGIAGAKLLILPSEFESLSISVLEAMSLSIPVIVNGKCKVLKSHCINSKAGLYYNNYYEFEETIRYLFENKDIYNSMKKNAKKYVDKNYRWDIIMKKFQDIISYVYKTNNPEMN
jgi:Glycosyltransferase